MGSRGWLAVGIAAVCVAVFWQVRDHAFVAYDDPAYVTENPLLEEGLGAQGVWRAFREPYFSNWIPLTLVSYQIERALWGVSPRATLLGNLAIHLAAALLLFLALERMSGERAPAAFVAAVFAVHPLQVESVAWASQRKDVLCALFWMLTLLAWARHAERPTPRRYAAVAAGVAASLLAKPMAVTLPLVLLLLDAWPLGRLRDPETGGRLSPARVRRALLEKLPLLALAALVAGITLAVQEEAGAVHAQQLPLSVRVLNAVDSYGHYLLDSVWPTGLAVLYPHPTDRLTPGAVAPAAAALALLSALALGLARRRPYLAVGWAWFLGTLVPVIGIVQVGVQARADRYTYLPLVGLAIAVAYGASDVARRFGAARRPLAVCAVLAVATLAVAAHRQVGYWRDNETLFARALAVTERNQTAHRQLGHARLEAGDLAGAEEHFREALAIQPGWARVQLDLGLVLVRQGRSEEAEQALDAALALGADEATARAALGQTAEQQGRSEAAIAHYRSALALRPGDPSIANNLAWLLATAEPASLRQPDEAIRLAEAALARVPDSPDVLDTLAAGYAAAGRLDDAVRTQTRAVRAAAAARRADFQRRLERYRALRQG